MQQRVTCPECRTQLAPDFVRCPSCHAFVMDFSPWRSDRNLISVPVALFLWWGLDALLRLESLPTRQVFGDNISRSILALGIYGACILVFKWRVTSQQGRAFRLVREICARHGARLSEEALTLARQQLTAARLGPFNNSLAYQRLQWLVGALVAERHIRPGLLEALRQHEETDWDALDSSFATMTFLIWLLPTIGFLGTVWGMMDALKSFSDLLQTGSDMGFQAGLMQTAKGLGVAFHTTLVGLAMVIPLLYFTTLARRRANFLLERLDKFFVRLSTHVLYDLDGEQALAEAEAQAAEAAAKAHAAANAPPPAPSLPPPPPPPPPLPAAPASADPAAAVASVSPPTETPPAVETASSAETPAPEIKEPDLAADAVPAPKPALEPPPRGANPDAASSPS